MTEATHDLDKATPSAAVEAEATERPERDLEAYKGRSVMLVRTDHARIILDLLTRLASEKARLEGEFAAIRTELDSEIEALRLAILGGEDAPGAAMSWPLDVVLDAHRTNVANSHARAERAEAERDAATKRASELERVCSDRLVRLDEALKRAEAAEGALKELHAMVWGEAPHLLDEDRAGNARLDLEIEAILNRPHGLAGEGAER